MCENLSEICEVTGIDLENPKLHSQLELFLSLREEEVTPETKVALKLLIDSIAKDDFQ